MMLSSRILRIKSLPELFPRTCGQLSVMRYYSKTSTDQAEVDKFDQFSTPTSQYNWHTSELLKPLRNLNKLRVPLIKNQIIADKLFNKEQIDNRLPLDKVNLLDVGCGGGLLSECLSRLGCKVIGIDANENNIKFAQNRLTKMNESSDTGELSYLHSDLDCFKSDQKFDAIVASEVLEHVNDVNEFIQNCANLLKENGLLFITTINQTPQSYLFAILLAENVLNLAPKNTHQYDKLVLLNGLSLILEESNFNVELVHGMCLNPITKEWSWCMDTSINYALVARKEQKII